MELLETSPSSTFRHGHKQAIDHINVTHTYPLELHTIKALFVTRQYRQCIQKCETELSTRDHTSKTDSYHVLYLSFYAGSANDCLATLMHDFSPVKLPTLEAAESLYLQAIDAIFSCYIVESSDLEETPAKISSHMGRTLPQMVTTPKASKFVSPNAISPRSPTPSHNTSAGYSPSVYSPSSIDELESHDSFEEIQTPTRVLARGISTNALRLPPPQMRLTPIQSPQVQPWRPNFALKGIGPSRLTNPNDLSGPITPASAPRASSFMDLRRSKTTAELSPFDDIPSRPLPAVPRSQSKSPEQTNASRHIHAIHRLPIPPFDQALRSQTKPLEGRPSTPNSPTQRDVSSIQGSDPKSSLNKTLQALHDQLKLHLSKLRETQSRTRTAQAERTAKRAQIQAGVEKGKLPQSRSYWSFSDPKAKDQERQKRIDEGKARGWKRERFDAEKYEKLAELALGELGV